MAGIEKFGTQTAKGVVIYAFRNGDKHHTGEKIVLHPTKQKTFDQVLLAMSTKLNLPTGNVRRVFTPNGKAVKQITEFKENGKYICCGAEKINVEQMPFTLQEYLASQKEKTKKQPEFGTEPASEPEAKEEKKEEVEEEVEAAETAEQEEQAPQAAKADKTSTPKKEGKIEKFGTQTDKGKILRVYRNGDKHHEGDRFVVHAKKYKTLDQLCTDITLKVGVSTGPVKKLVYLHENAPPKVIASLDEIQDRTCVLACGAEAVKENLVHPSYFERTKKDTDKRKAPLDQGRSEPASEQAQADPKDIERFGTQTDKGRVIFVFKNGDKHDKGARMVIHNKKFKNISQVYTEMNARTPLPTGAVRRVYRPDGTYLKSLEDFEEGGCYICAGAEPFKKELLSPALLSKINA